MKSWNHNVEGHTAEPRGVYWLPFFSPLPLQRDMTSSLISPSTLFALLFSAKIHPSMSPNKYFSPSLSNKYLHIWVQNNEKLVGGERLFCKCLADQLEISSLTVHISSLISDRVTSSVNQRLPHQWTTVQTMTWQRFLPFLHFRECQAAYYCIWGLQTWELCQLPLWGYCDWQMKTLTRESS